MCARAGLDTDKLDYLVRDQFMALSRYRQPHPNIDLPELYEQARIVAWPPVDAGVPGAQTIIAFHFTKFWQDAINRIFKARASMHQTVYQCGYASSLWEWQCPLASCTVATPTSKGPDHRSQPTLCQNSVSSRYTTAARNVAPSKFGKR